MASVPVRIPADKHARLRDIAETRNEPIGQVISQMIDEIEEQRFWEEARRSIAAAMADPKITGRRWRRSSASTTARLWTDWSRKHGPTNSCSARRNLER